MLTVKDVHNGEVSSELLLEAFAKNIEMVKAIREELSLRIREVDNEVNRIFIDCIKRVIGQSAQFMLYVVYSAYVNLDGFIDVKCSISPTRVTEAEAIRIQRDVIEALITVYMLPREMIRVRFSGNLVKIWVG